MIVIAKDRVGVASPVLHLLRLCDREQLGRQPGLLIGQLVTQFEPLHQREQFKMHVDIRRIPPEPLAVTRGEVSARGFDVFVVQHAECRFRGPLVLQNDCACELPVILKM